MLTNSESIRTKELCENNPYKAMEIAELIFKELQMKTITEFAEISTVSERTLYNWVQNPEFANIEFSIFCNDKYIPAKLNSSLLK